MEGDEVYAVSLSLQAYLTIGVSTSLSSMPSFFVSPYVCYSACLMTSASRTACPFRILAVAVALNGGKVRLEEEGHQSKQSHVLLLPFVGQPTPTRPTLQMIHGRFRPIPPACTQHVTRDQARKPPPARTWCHSPKRGGGGGGG